MYTQVLQVALGDHLAHGVGQRADTKLQGTAICHVLHHKLRDLHLRLGGLAGLHIGQRAMLPLHDHVHIADMDALVQTAIDPGQILIYLQNNDIRLVQHSSGRGIADGEIKIPVLIHGRHAHHGHIHRKELRVIPAQVPEHHGAEVAQTPVAQLTLIPGHMPAVVNKMLPRGVALHHLDGLRNEVSPHLHTPQLILAACNGGVHQGRKGSTHRDVDPVTALNNSRCLVRSAELALIFGCIIKRNGHSFLASLYYFSFVNFITFL